MKITVVSLYIPDSQAMIINVVHKIEPEINKKFIKNTKKSFLPRFNNIQTIDDNEQTYDKITPHQNPVHVKEPPGPQYAIDCINILKMKPTIAKMTDNPKILNFVIETALLV